MKKGFLFISFLLLGTAVFAQKKVTLTIKHLLGSAPFAYGTKSTNNKGQEFTYSRVEYYVSQISIIHDGGKITPVSGKYILAQGDKNVIEELGSFSVTNVEGVKFYIGVEKPTNNQDPTLWPATHPLSPKSPSMHWGWTAGYRFIALEGKAGSSLTTSFELHGLEANPGSSSGSNYFEQTVMAAGVVGSDGNITVNLDADYVQAIKDIDVAAGPIHHGTNNADYTALVNFKNEVFSPGPGIPTAIKERKLSLDLKVYPNPTKGDFSISINNAEGNVNAQVFDITGRHIQTLSLSPNGSNTFHLNQRGIFYIRLYGENGSRALEKLIVE